MMTGGETMIITVGTINTPLDSTYKNKALEISGALVIWYSLTLGLTVLFEDVNYFFNAAAIVLPISAGLAAT